MSRTNYVGGKTRNVRPLPPPRKSISVECPVCQAPIVLECNIAGVHVITPMCENCNSTIVGSYYCMKNRVLALRWITVETVEKE